MNEIGISNLDLAPFLLVRGFTIERLDQNRSTIIFVFADPENKAKLAISEYYKDAPVPAKSFNAASRQCRDMMFELKRQSSFSGNDNETHKSAGR